jgi:hypothetical protein
MRSVSESAIPSFHPYRLVGFPSHTHLTSKHHCTNMPKSSGNRQGAQPKFDPKYKRRVRDRQGRPTNAQLRARRQKEAEFLRARDGSGSVVQGLRLQRFLAEEREALASGAPVVDPVDGIQVVSENEGEGKWLLDVYVSLIEFNKS